MWEEKQTVGDKSSAVNTADFAVEWFANRLNEVKAELNGQFKEFRLSEALKTIYSLIWDDFCSWYLEWVKPPMGESIDKTVYEKTVGFFEELMQLLHPFLPFVTEEVYHTLKERKDGDDLTVKQFAVGSPQSATILAQGALLKNVITGLRDARNKNQIKPKEKINLFIESESVSAYQSITAILGKQAHVERIEFVNTPVSPTISTVIGKDKFYIQTEQPLDTSNQKDELLKDLAYQKGFLATVEKKLGNEKFVANAKPEVVAIEQKKKADAEARIKAIEESLASLST
jgi:valyl-tRNA synthetase